MSGPTTKALKDFGAALKAAGAEEGTVEVHLPPAVWERLSDTVLAETRGDMEWREPGERTREGLTVAGVRYLVRFPSTPVTD